MKLSGRGALLCRVFFFFPYVALSGLAVPLAFLPIPEVGLLSLGLCGSIIALYLGDRLIVEQAARRRLAEEAASRNIALAAAQAVRDKEDRALVLARDRAEQSRLERVRVEEREALSRSRRRLELIERAKLDAFARAEWNRYHALHDGEHVDDMSGYQFEEFLGRVFSRLGYVVEFTSASADQGIDLIIKKGGERIGVQAKRYSDCVGNSAVQELIAGMMYYGCERGFLVTNSQLTRSARELADKVPKVEVFERAKLLDLCVQAKMREIPQFSIEAWKNLEKRLNHSE